MQFYQQSVSYIKLRWKAIGRNAAGCVPRLNGIFGLRVCFILGGLTGKAIDSNEALDDLCI